MEITLTQGILIGLVTAFCYSGMLLGTYFGRYADSSYIWSYF